MKKAMKTSLLFLALSVSFTRLFSNYYGTTGKTNTVEIFGKGSQAATNDFRQTERADIHFYTQDESISSICRKN